ncbi:phosphate transport system regulatory protein PhoU [Ectothiorhodospiraceae bacterium BW-2]|nr:phosphate transport system regulatory protein PhoU [Ectothiorhodospiraceae bacterium BW-2]
MEFRQHILQKYNADIEEIRTLLSRMSGLVQQQASLSSAILSSQNSRFAETVTRNQSRIRHCALLLGEKYTHILACYQPTARDLRLIIVIIKSTTDLERLGIHLASIARYSLSMERKQEHDLECVMQLSQLSERVNNSLEMALISLVTVDAAKAREVVNLEAAIDCEYQSILKQLNECIIEHPSQVGQVLNTMWILRAMDQVRDHTLNICDSIVTLVVGKSLVNSAITE